MKDRPRQVRLGSEDLEDHREACPLCSSRAPRTAVFRVQESPPVDWLFCPVCHGHSASMMPTESFLRSYYATYYHAGDPKVTVGRPAALARHIAALLPGLGDDKLTMLDFGGGDGSIATLLADRLRRARARPFFEIVVVDWNRVLDRSTEGYSLESVSELAAVRGRQFDIVLASAVLEHIPRAGSALRNLFDLLGPGGAFYARTPWVVPLKKLVRGYPLQFPMHVHDLGPSFWNRIGARRALEIVATRPSLVASGFSPRELPVTLAAFLLKLPGHLENRLRGRPRDLVWGLVGGWEVLLRRPEAQGKVVL